MGKKLTQEEVIESFREVHGDRYDYSLVEYVGNKIKVKIICKEHGVFEQIPNNHLLGHGCPKCVNKGLDIIERVKKFREVHGDRYDYSLVEYIKTSIKVNIICHTHGIFPQTPSSHLQGRGCPKCANGHVPTTKECKEKFREVHGDRYDYSLVEYINSCTKVNIICAIHGIFPQTPDSHLQGCGCPKCADMARQTMMYEGSGILYYIKITRDGKTYYKIGVTKHDVETRFKQEKNIQIEELQTTYYEDVVQAYEEEMLIKEKFFQYTTRDKVLDLGGNSEVYDVDVLGLDK
jgi:hypothetical protein